LIRRAMLESAGLVRVVRHLVHLVRRLVHEK
jgi:hypothetical protein